jgi:hypothetical protein
MKRDRRNDLYPIRLCEGIYAGSLLKDIALKSAMKSYKSQLLQRLQTNNDTRPGAIQGVYRYLSGTFSNKSPILTPKAWATLSNDFELKPSSGFLHMRWTTL